MAEKRLIDADGLKVALRTEDGAKALGHSVYRLFYVDDIIDQQPTVDAVEVVRCGECKNRFTRHQCQGRRMDWYCASGERRRDV